jgi:hypothetical protein
VKSRLRRIITALAGFIALSLVSWYFLSLPGSMPVDEDKPPVAHAGEALILRGIKGQALAITSAPGASATISADLGRLDSTTRSGLALLGQQTPDAPTAVQWVNQGGGGSASITLTLMTSAKGADIEIRRSFDPQSIDLYFTPRGAALNVSAVVPYSDSAQSDTLLHLADQTIVQRGAGAVPLTFVIADGATVSVRLPSTDQSAARFALGQSAQGLAQPLTMAAVSIANADGVRADYCGSADGSILWKTHHLEETQCLPALRASQLMIGENMGIDLSGFAFQSVNGVVAPSPLLSRITGNPIPAAFLAICYTAIAGWLFKAIFPQAKKDGE